MKQAVVIILTLSILMGAFTGCAKQETAQETVHIDISSETTLEPSKEAPGTITIAHSYATASSGVELRMANTEYFENMTRNDLDYRVGKKGATLEELKLLAQAQGDDFTDEEKQGIDETLHRIQARFQEIGFRYPSDLEIVFVKNKMKDEYGAIAYTHIFDIKKKSERIPNGE